MFSMEALGWDEAVAFLVLIGSQALVVYCVIRCRQSIKRDPSAPDDDRMIALTTVGPQLYACEYELSAQDAASLKRLNVTHIVLIDSSGFPPEEPTALSREFYVRTVTARNTSSFPLSDRFDEVSSFISSAKDVGGAAAVSGGGGSFSIASALLLAHRIIAYRQPLFEAFAQLDQLHPMDALNLGFWRQLEKLEREVGCQASTGRSSLALEDAVLHILRRNAGARYDEELASQLVAQHITGCGDNPLPEWWELAEMSEQLFCSPRGVPSS